MTGAPESPLGQPGQPLPAQAAVLVLASRGPESSLTLLVHSKADAGRNSTSSGFQNHMPVMDYYNFLSCNCFSV